MPGWRARRVGSGDVSARRGCWPSMRARRAAAAPRLVESLRRHMGASGGARHEGESAADGAMREAREEAGVPVAAVTPRFERFFDVGYWTYTTVVGDVVEPFEPVISDPESHELAWVAAGEVDARPLHPGSPRHGSTCAACSPCARLSSWMRRTSWGRCRTGGGAIARGPRHGLSPAFRRSRRRGFLRRSWGCRSIAGFPRSRSSWRGRRAPSTCRPDGRASCVQTPRGMTRSSRRRVGSWGAGREVTVVTSDRGLVARVAAEGARTRGAGWLLERLPA